MHETKAHMIEFARSFEDSRNPNHCPVCGSPMWDRFIGDICDVCFWECDPGSERHGQDKWSYPNNLTIEQAIDHWWSTKTPVMNCE